MSSASDFIIENGVLTKYVGPGGDVTIPEGVTSIGDGAFRCCESLKSVTIPDSVTSIGNGAFGWCKSLTSITIPDSVTSIGNEAFWGCGSLTSITLPDSVTSIGGEAFSGCSSLTSITLPDGVTSIGDKTFKGCKKLADPEGFVIVKGVLYDYCGSSRKIVVPDSVTSIGNGAFYICSRLTSITIPDGVTSIGNWAFSGCSSLTSITLPDGVTSIGNWTFSDCSSLTSIALPDSVTSIGDEAFADCKSLTNVTFPENITAIGDDLFGESCSKHIKIHYGGKLYKKLPKEARDYTMLAWLKGEATFSDAQMKYIRAELYRKRKNAIVLLKCGGNGWECADINELKCLLPFPHHIDGFDPDSGEMLERLLSCGKEKLSELEEYLECVNDGKHPAMMSVLLAHINRLSDGKSAAWLDSEELFTAPDDSQTLKKEWKFKKDNALGGYKIMAYLGKDPCPTMPETIDSVPVVAIGSEAFRFLRIPTGMHLPKTLKVIGKHAFAESNISELVIPDEVTALPALFLGCDYLKRVVLPAKLEKLNPWTFPPHTSSAYSRYDGAAWALEEIDICNDNPHFAACDGVLIDREKGTILHFPAKKTTFTVPACVKKIDSGVFSFTDIKDLKIHAEVLSISEAAFVGCVGLTLHAPAGSYAESYAKEHNIPFVAE